MAPKIIRRCEMVGYSRKDVVDFIVQEKFTEFVPVPIFRAAKSDGAETAYKIIIEEVDEP